MTSEPDAYNPPVGIAEPIADGLLRLTAPNPSPMTYRGTNTYLLGHSGLAVIDPGPDSEAHLEAIMGALEPSQKITHICVTHAHLDHSPLAARLARRTGAAIYGFGPAEAGRSEIMQRLARDGLAGGGEGIDNYFSPDIMVADGDRITGQGWALDVLHTPGHIGNHLCFGWSDACFTGDHVMGWASSLVSPPDGDLTDFMSSCEKLKIGSWRIFYPGHGPQIDKPMERLDWLIQHRKGRESEILSELGQGRATADQLARRIYSDIPATLLGAATRNVFAHLVALTDQKLVKPIGLLTSDSTFERLPRHQAHLSGSNTTSRSRLARAIGPKKYFD